MDPQKHTFGGGATATLLHPLVLIALIISSILIFTLPQKKVIIPVLFSTFLVPLGQQFYIAGVHLFVLRLLILAAVIRGVLSTAGSGSIFAGKWNRIDTAFACWTVTQTIAVILLYQSSEAIVNQVGFVWDYMGAYVLLRCLIRDEEDIYTALKCLAVLSVLLSVAMLIEQFKEIDIFGLLGGTSIVPELREGKVRSQAVFQHSLMAGSFAAPLIPLFVLLWKNAKAKLLAIVGVVGATIMAVTTQTSTSLITYMAGLAALALWPLRKRMRTVRLAIIGVLISLHLVMKAPVWFLIARVDLTGSSSSYHRAEVVDQFINHFSSWWLIGTKDVASWGWDMWDAQNQFVSVGEAGGLLALTFLVLVISRSFGRLGDARKVSINKKQEWFLWFLGAALFAHVVAFFGVNYFDQVKVAWFTLLAMISAYTSTVLTAAKQPAPAVDDFLSAHDEEFSSPAQDFLDQQSRATCLR